jgi:hypothetical protein
VYVLQACKDTGIKSPAFLQPQPQKLCCQPQLAALDLEIQGPVT